MVGKLQQINSMSQAYRIRWLSPSIPINVRRYGQLSKQGQKENGPEGRVNYHQGKEGHDGYPAERAPSTAEEFRRVAEEKARHGFATQTADGFQEAAVGDSNSESVKESLKEPPGTGNFHKTDDERSPLEK